MANTLADLIAAVDLEGVSLDQLTDGSADVVFTSGDNVETDWLADTDTAPVTEDAPAGDGTIVPVAADVETGAAIRMMPPDLIEDWVPLDDFVLGKPLWTGTEDTDDVETGAVVHMMPPDLIEDWVYVDDGSEGEVTDDGSSGEEIVDDSLILVDVGFGDDFIFTDWNPGIGGEEIFIDPIDWVVEGDGGEAVDYGTVEEAIDSPAPDDWAYICVCYPPEIMI